MQRKKSKAMIFTMCGNCGFSHEIVRQFENLAKACHATLFFNWPLECKPNKDNAGPFQH
jgi:hypothetical protein